MKALILVLVAVIIAITGMLILGPRITDHLGWPTWLAYGLVFVDLAVVCAIPFTWQETTANIALATHRISLARSSADYPPGCAYLLILAFVLAPLGVLAWLLYAAFA